MIHLLLETVPVFPWDELVQKYGFAIAEAIVVATGFATGRIRFRREIVREREISEAKDVLLATMTAENKENTMALNRLADGLEERNRIERELRGRRT